jgi:hypothetical protein
MGCVPESVLDSKGLGSTSRISSIVVMKKEEQVLAAFAKARMCVVEKTPTLEAVKLLEVLKVLRTNNYVSVNVIDA